ncbi:unnamed protein product [Pocillopora meandrina]|uniref:Uncharacterized protein n=1 Tax=Pocillopora meandrina TaxID=46732 RepID=A0AAU9XHL8_9CNID|nr:unnamed protein product [Pocillopora meandrina]
MLFFTKGVAFFKKLTNIAWYLDPHIPKFIERSLKMPKLIMGLYDDIDNVALATSPQSFIGYNDWKGKKKARPQILHEELLEKVAEVYDMLQFAWLARSEWKTFKQVGALLPLKNNLSEIGNSMKKYHCMLERNNEKISANQMSLNLPRSPFTDATITTVLSKGSGPVLERYNDLFHEIQTRPCYDPIFLNDLIGDDATKDARYHYVSTLLKNGLPGVSFDVLKYSPGGSWRTCVFFWKVPNDGTDRQLSDRVAEVLKQDMPTFHTRAMKAEFRSRFGNVAKITPAIRRANYRFLTDDSSANDNAISNALDIRMAVAINSEDPDLAVDLREMNEGRPEKYEVFWEALGSYLEEHMAAQERRHGDVGYMPVAITKSYPKKPQFHLRPGFAISFGQKTPVHVLRPSTLEGSMFGFMFKLGKLGISIQTYTTVQLWQST